MIPQRSGLFFSLQCGMHYNYIAEFSTIILFVEKHSKFGAILKTS